MPSSCLPPIAALALAAVVLLAVLMAAKARGGREGYGPPPGRWRALSHFELPDDRGWPGMPQDFEGSSASSMSQFMLMA